jgi:hypothetical protein
VSIKRLSEQATYYDGLVPRARAIGDVLAWLGDAELSERVFDLVRSLEAKAEGKKREVRDSTVVLPFKVV